MGTIALEGLRFFAHHGVYASEQIEGNDFIVDLYLDTDGMGSGRDDINDVLDYAQVYDVVVEAMANRANLLETLVNRIGRRIMQLYPEVNSAKVRVSKMDPPLSGEAARTYVENTYQR